MDVQAADSRRSLRRLRALLAAGMILGLLLSVSFAGTAQAATTLNVGIGVGTGTTAGNVYLPGEVTVLVGDSVKFTTESDEPHSVTFGNGPAVPPQLLLWLHRHAPAAPGTGALTGTYNGTGFLNTELMFRLQCDGDVRPPGLPFICQIHPGMSGTVISSPRCDHDTGRGRCQGG
jgi:plastocyanin